MTQATPLPEAQAIAAPRKITFTVYGTPQQAGSKNAHNIRRKGGELVTNKRGQPVIFMEDQNKKARPWMDSVRIAAADALPLGFELLDGPIQVSVEFRFFRPKSHYRTGKRAGELRGDAPFWHVSAKDLDKLQRAIGDALTGVVIRDDRLIAKWQPHKVYTEGPEMAIVVVEKLDGMPALSWVPTVTNHHLGVEMKGGA